MTIKKIFSASDIQLKKALKTKLLKYGYTIHNADKFLYAEGNAPYMLVAHLDTVHKNPPSIICHSKDGNYMMSPQGIGGDDRCGVYIILELLQKLPFKPHIVFTMDEEIGALGAYDFVNYLTEIDYIPELKYIVEYDRKGNKDCVFYQCANEEFIDFVESFGFVKDYGSFTDISIIARELGVAAVNLSSGYYNPHTLYEYVSMSDMNNIIKASVKMLCTDCERFPYIEKTSSYSCYKQVNISVIPANTVKIYSYTGYSRYNVINEVAVDKDGNFYIYSYDYNEYETLNAKNVFPVDGFVPKYDPNKAKAEWVYTYKGANIDGVYD